MPRLHLAPALTALALTAALTGCTAQQSPSDAPVPSGTASNDAVVSNESTTLPACSEITTAMGTLVTDLTYNRTVSAGQLGQESYPQRVCVYTNADESVQLGVTISEIPFLESELEQYGQLPTAIADERATAIHSVLQTLAVENGPGDHLDSTLFLYDTTYSIAILGQSVQGDTTDSLPGLTVAAAADAAFAVRALIN